MYSALDVAKFVITFCTSIGNPISNLQLQKILYFLQVHFAKQFERLYRDDLYAWQYGPVIPDIYYLFAGYGASEIASKYDINIREQEQQEIIPIIKRLIQIDPWQLVEMTHKKGGPWDWTYDEGRGINGIINFEMLINDENEI